MRTCRRETYNEQEYRAYQQAMLEERIEGFRREKERKDMELEKNRDFLAEAYAELEHLDEYKSLPERQTVVNKKRLSREEVVLICAQALLLPQAAYLGMVQDGGLVLASSLCLVAVAEMYLWYLLFDRTVIGTVAGFLLLSLLLYGGTTIDRYAPNRPQVTIRNSPGEPTTMRTTQPKIGAAVVATPTVPLEKVKGSIGVNTPTDKMNKGVQTRRKMGVRGVRRVRPPVVEAEIAPEHERDDLESDEFWESAQRESENAVGSGSRPVDPFCADWENEAVLQCYPQIDRGLYDTCMAEHRRKALETGCEVK